MNLIWKKPVPLNPHTTTVIVFHGFGANAEQLEVLPGRIESNPKFTNLKGKIQWLFPQAPIFMEEGHYAWFPSDRKEIEIALAGQYFQYLSEATIPDLSNRVSEISADIEELGLKWENCFVCGYSQGSMIALRLALEKSLNLKGIILLSTTLVDRTNLSIFLKNAPTCPVFQCHGLNDEVLSYEKAVELRDILQKTGWKVDFHQYNGGHEIPLEMEEGFTSFIQRLL